MNIEQMARACGDDIVQHANGAIGFTFEAGELERFAALVRAQALEEAAITGGDAADFSHSGDYVAAAIRALKASPNAEVK